VINLAKNRIGSSTARGGVIVNTAYARASGMVSFIFAQAPLTIGVQSP
jgi:hypothetical protein